MVLRDNSGALLNPKRRQKNALMRKLNIKSGKTFQRLAKRARREQRNAVN